MACDRPAVVAIEAMEGIEDNMQALANDAHCGAPRRTVYPLTDIYSRRLRSCRSSHWAPLPAGLGRGSREAAPRGDRHTDRRGG
jgi:hypothetical protein